VTALKSQRSLRRAAIALKSQTNRRRFGKDFWEDFRVFFGMLELLTLCGHNFFMTTLTDSDDTVYLRDVFKPMPLLLHASSWLSFPHCQLSYARRRCCLFLLVTLFVIVPIIVASFFYRFIPMIPFSLSTSLFAVASTIVNFCNWIHFKFCQQTSRRLIALSMFLLQLAHHAALLFVRDSLVEPF
jgi:hypothetical protein